VELSQQHRSEAKKNQETINRLNETVHRISIENERLHAEVTDVMVLLQQHLRVAKENQETMNRLNETADRFSYERKMLKQAIDLLCTCTGNSDINIARRDEAVECLSAAGYTSFTNKEVSHSFASCREPGKFKQNFKGRWLPSGSLRRVVWWNLPTFQRCLGDDGSAVTTETSLHYYQTTRCNNPDDSHHHTRCYENLKFQNFKGFVREETKRKYYGLNMTK
jgi:hypothetical protein